MWTGFIRVRTRTGADSYIVSFRKCLGDISSFKNLELFNSHEYKFLSYTVNF